MYEEWYGGNRVTKIDYDEKLENTMIKFSEYPYDYFLVSLFPNQVFTLSHLKAGTLFFLKGDPHDKIIISKSNSYLDKGDSIEINNLAIELFAQNGSAVILVSGI